MTSPLAIGWERWTRWPTPSAARRSTSSSRTTSLSQNEIQSYKIRKPIIVDGLIGVPYRGVSRLVVLPSVVENVLKSLHDGQNHLGIRKTVELVASRYWWPNRDDYIRKYVKTCRTCRLVKPQRGHALTPLSCTYSWSSEYRLGTGHNCHRNRCERFRQEVRNHRRRSSLSISMGRRR